MRLKLKNFRCHVDNEFTFKDEGLTLLSGKNGQGKSTILEAIYFALYGDVKKPYTFGANTCRVELDIYDMKIVRTCRPNRLLLEFEESVYEDTEAQCLIDQHIMNPHEFLASSYIKQKSNSSILAMTPTEQVQFVKNIAFDANTNIKIKETIKNMIKDVSEDLIKEEKNVELAESQLEEMQNEDEYKVKNNPLKEDEQDFLKACKKLKSNLEHLQNLKKKTQEELNVIDEHYKKHKDALEKKKKLEFEVEQLEAKLEKLPEPDEDIEKEEVKLEKLNKIRMQFLMYDKYLEEEQIFDEEYEEYFMSLDQKCKELEAKLLKNYDQMLVSQKEYLLYEDMQKKVSIVKQEFEREFPKVKFKSVSSALKHLQEHNGATIYKCPCCGKNLCLKENQLAETQEKREGPSYDSWINTLKESLNYTQKEDHQHLLDQHLLASEELSKLKKIRDGNILPEHLQRSLKRLEAIRTCEPEDIDEEELDKQIEKLENYLEQQWKLQSSISNIEKALEKGYKEIESLNVKSMSVDGEKLRNQLLDISNKLERTLISTEKYNKTKYLLGEYKSYLKHVEAIKKWQKKLKSYQRSYETLRQRHTDLMILREKSNQAEVLALDSITENINEHAKHYLDEMFQTDPIVVRIETCKQTKKDIKCKMNTMIQYRGAEYDSVDQLSGGERQKCELAFELAVNAIMNSKILMLDECINNLDPEVNGEILELLSQYAKEHEKLIIVVSHECVTGLFDCIYKLK